ncbi:hypothetical protein BJF83_20500 [Nocardiopsis sp. CNR-923]|uniref:S1 family peptidase n=1 Tax=Nocardiopsis sp. CNR-923 TaxID=1904965 RepID=UPI0009695F38|nr:serine protease [Nocardiopsis sp. CNR-923]OLT26610.1 hypothetical protein BJF83_20500 [Nocardiopsis sp. CNR-923]
MVETYPWRAQIQVEYASGTVARGAGFLVDKQHVITCEHVIRGCEGYALHVYFPQLRSSVPATVLTFGTDPDVAVLQLTSATAVTPARLSSARISELVTEAEATRSAPGLKLRTLGFPRTKGRSTQDGGQSTGQDAPTDAGVNDLDGIAIGLRVMADGEVEAHGWQIETTDNEDLREGHSGGAAYVYETSAAEQYGRVVGIVRKSSGLGNRGKIIPLSSISLVWEEIDDLIPFPWADSESRASLRRICTSIPDDLDFRSILRQQDVPVPRMRLILSPPQPGDGYAGWRRNSSV